MVKRVAYAWDRLVAPPRGTVILIFHRVGRRTESRVDLPEWLFEEQMAFLSQEGTASDLGDVLPALGVGADASAVDRVVVTFDDGTADFVDVALPVLVRFQIPVTLYVATDFVESGRPFPQDAQPVSWAGLADAVSTGLVTIGSHTHSHLLLDRLSPAAAAEDLDRSIDLIGSRLGLEARHFAYPKAVLATPQVEVVVRSRFLSAAVAGTRANIPGRTDTYRLSRSPVQVDDGTRYFRRKVTGGMRLEDELRRLANVRRLAGKTN